MPKALPKNNLTICRKTPKNRRKIDYPQTKIVKLFFGKA